MSSLTAWLERFRDARILVAGEIGIDEYIWGDSYRISPEAPVPIVEVDSQTAKLGLAANVAQNLISLGAVAEVVSVRGDDSDGERITQMLAEASIPQTTIVDKSRPTLRKVRIIAQKQQIVRVDYERSHILSPEISGSLREKIAARLERFDAIIIQDYGKGLWNPDTVSIIGTARKIGKPVYVDPNRLSPVNYYTGATLLTPNLAEAEALCGAPRSSPKILGPNDCRLRELAEQILNRTGAEHSLITCGEWGMVGLEKATGTFRRIPTFAREVSDVTGAGDTVIAIMALMHSLGADIESCMKVANAAAGIVVGRMGTAFVTPAELREALNDARMLAAAQ